MDNHELAHRIVDELARGAQGQRADAFDLLTKQEETIGLRTRATAVSIVEGVLNKCLEDRPHSLQRRVDREASEG